MKKFFMILFLTGIIVALAACDQTDRGDKAQETEVTEVSNETEPGQGLVRIECIFGEEGPYISELDEDLYDEFDEIFKQVEAIKSEGSYEQATDFYLRKEGQEDFSFQFGELYSKSAFNKTMFRIGND